MRHAIQWWPLSLLVLGGCAQILFGDREDYTVPAETEGSGGTSYSFVTSSSMASSSSGTTGIGGMGGGGMGGAGGTGGASGGAMTTTAETYCTRMMTYCVGADAQYPSYQSCLSVAATFPVGMEFDTTGNSLGCRAYHSGAAMTDPQLHCPHAGPAGGTYCGTSCEGFCDIAVTTCAVEWPDRQACLTICGAFMSTGVNYNTSFTSGDTIECRLYHVTVAATDVGAAATHCPHTTTPSPACQ